MKYLSLEQAMLGMRIELTNAGFTVKSPAGKADYDAKGRRLSVNGRAYYFPEHLRVVDKRKNNITTVRMSGDGMEWRRYDGTMALRVGRLEISNEREKQLEELARKVRENVSAVISNAIANDRWVEVQRQNALTELKKEIAELRESIPSAVRTQIHKELAPNGALGRVYWRGW